MAISEKLRASDSVGCNVEGSNSIHESLFAKTTWTTECWRDGKLIWVEKDRPNTVTTEGKDRILDTMFNSATQITTWYVLLFEDDYTPLVGDTYDVPGFTECVSYDNIAVRATYTSAASSSGSVTNTASKADFTISATKTVYGTGLVSVNTRGDHTAGANNVLFSASKFTAGRAVVDNDILHITITVAV